MADGGEARSARAGRSGQAALALGLCALLMQAGPAADAPDTQPATARLIRDLAGADAAAEARAARRLAAMSDAAVDALAGLAGSSARPPGRLVAVEILGQIGTPRARDALIALLRREKHLAVRGQICMQLGHARDARAVPVIAEWLQTIGPKSINDVGGPKEVQPSTCYIRHVEALAMIGDERAIGILEAFEPKIPKGIGYGGFITSFVKGAVAEALTELKERAAFNQAVSKHAGLANQIAPLWEHFRTDPVARFRLHEDEVVRRTAQGRAILKLLTGHRDAAIAAAAKALLARYDGLGG